jgi:hypothetical protein
MISVLLIILCVSAPVRYMVWASDDQQLPQHLKPIWGRASVDKNPFYTISIDRPSFEETEDGHVKTRGAARGLLEAGSEGSGSDLFLESVTISPSTSPSISPSSSESTSQSIAISPALIVSGIGGPCNVRAEPQINGGCQIGLVCNKNNICVGPAKTGENCNTTNSHYLCHNGNWCHCDPALFGNACYCEAEVQDGAPCVYDYQCRGRSGCNRGVCTKWFSVEKGDASESFDYCRPGLLYDPLHQSCVNPDKKSCNTQLDCAPGWPGVTDNILYECKENKCHYNGANCWSFLVETNTYLDYNNYYDEGRQRLSTSLLESYSWCVYQGYHAKGASPSPLQLFRQATNYNGEYFTYLQTTWVDTGGNCSSPTTRCKMGSYCANHTCVLFPGLNDACGLSPYATNDRGKYSMCDVTEYTQCNRVIADDYTVNYTGSIGKCVKGNAKNGSLCSYNYTVYDRVAVYDYELCDWDKNYYCNYNHNVGDYYTGYCTSPATVGAGMVASDDYFCKNGLAFGYFGPGWPKCMNLQDTGVNCTSWHDCINFDFAYIGFYYDDYHFVYEPYEYGWNYGEYYRRQVECRAEKCHFINTDTCQKKLEKAATYDERDQFFPTNCKYLTCQLVNDTTSEYKYCATSASYMTHPSTLVIAIVMTIAGMLFGVF